MLILKFTSFSTRLSNLAQHTYNVILLLLCCTLAATQGSVWAGELLVDGVTTATADAKDPEEDRNLREAELADADWNKRMERPG